ncbi:exodeoxyribonuclease V subunit beta [Halomonas cibimaris]|uniref:RecBCD enzyme subunit RecB n=1 Tax=Halomonas cibimaris TaxID=657012 RepID=A0ABP7L100_9GAMM
MSQLPLTLPLRGNQLIEASAGTGKTFTIALLYVRLVLGHGQPDSDDSQRANGFFRPLIPPEILVVTFTEAASRELRERIRARLVDAADAFRADAGDDGLAARDPLLAALRDDMAPHAWPGCARRLTLAAEWMDDAAIATIHGWSQRMLKEHAFDSARLFRQEVVKDLTELTREAVTDYWRTRVYPLTEGLAAAMLDLFPSPDALHGKLRPLLQRDDARLVFGGEPLAAGDFSRQLNAYRHASEAAERLAEDARQAYLADAGAVHDALHALRDAMSGNTFRGVKDDATFAEWLAQLAAWGRGDITLAEAGFVTKLARGRLKLKKGHALPDMALFDRLEDWRTYRDESQTLERELAPRVLADARDWVRRRLADTLEANAQLGFDDMIRGLAEALDGDGGDALVRRIREQFPVAMIDEFQDTDPAQYRIFERIYFTPDSACHSTPDAAPEAGVTADGEEAAALVLIGDPKQAIYGFRGGDIYTYLAARRATRGRHHSLDTNFRSAEVTVEAVNRLFARAERRHARAAFRFAPAADTPGAEAHNPLPFAPVQANGRREVLHLDGRPAAGLTGWLLSDADHDAGLLSKTAYLKRAAHRCADRLAQWLNQADADPSAAGFIPPDGTAATPLRAGDIAILVRDRREAAAIRDALSERGLASVYLSDRDSVFATAEARDLLQWLKAMASPESVTLLRAALATATLGLSLAELDRLQRDETAWERVQERFIGYRRRWQRRGVLPALRQLLHDYRIPARLLAAEQGQRRLTNLLHLTEWAQQASDTLDGDHALLRLLAEHLQEPGKDEQILRLESDANLIQVVTVFKAKGLEYPLVCLPFLCTYKPISGQSGTPLYHDADDRPVLELATSQQTAGESFARADDERLSEEVRLLYVALTRARHATFVGLAPLRLGKAKTATLHKSALGYLLAGGEPIPDLADLRQRWAALAENSPAIALEEEAGAPSRYRPVAAPVPAKPARTPGHRAFAPWWIASYSALQQRGAAAPETPKAAVLDEGLEEETSAAPALAPLHRRAPAADTLHAFPRGPGPGTFLHGILEALAEHGFAAARHDTALLERLARRCQRRGWDDHIDTLRHAMAQWLATPLIDDGTLTLAELARYRAEPDFWFATADAMTPALDKLTRAHLFPGASRPQLGYQRLNGLLKGFIDLLAEHNGRFYIIDWKSNWLGPDDDAYHADALRRAMLDKRYDMQLALYLVAVHRHLRQTLPDYDYERHVGGAMLVFLRGIQAPSRGVIPIKPPLAFIDALDRCLAGDRAAAKEGSP